MADGKIITDILPPEQPKDVKLNEEPVISKHASSGTFGAKDDNNPTETVSTNAETLADANNSEKISTKTGVNISPINEDLKQKSNQEEVDTKPAEATAKEVSDFVSAPESETHDNSIEEINTNEDTVNSDGPYEASDSLPDENTKLNAETTDNMQSPKIYDTKEYFVPINKTKHSHGTTGIILAGLITAVVVAVIVIFASIFWF